MTGAIDIEEVVEHTEGLAEDNGWSFGTAATRMARYLEGVDPVDIIEAQ